MFLLIIIIVFIVMEGVAWFTHKYVMHGFLWSWHHDHHIPGKSFFEKNDRFFLLFAIPAFCCLLYGSIIQEYTWMAVGTGITLYGIAYFLVHDVFIHQRFNWFRNSDNIYLKAIRRAHKMHHKHITKENGECFGMLWVPVHYFIEARKHKKIQAK